MGTARFASLCCGATYDQKLAVSTSPMSTRGGRGGWAGDKTKRFMMVGTKDALPAGAKTGVVAPVPINTPSLRQEIHGSQGDNAGIASINRSSSAGGWGSAAGGSSASEGPPADQGNAGGKGKGRVDAGSRKGGDDVFTRHFPDLRAGLEQAEKLDAVTKASSKVAPLRKPKPEPAKGQGPSLRPRAMLKPTGSAGGGSAATAAAQAAIADAVHNRVATAPKPEERRKPVASFADEISSKSRWAERPPQEGGARGRGGRGGDGRAGGGSAWESNKEGDRGVGKGGREFDRGGRGGDASQDKDRKNFRHNPDRSSMNNTRGRESIFGSGGHVGVANSSQDSAINGATKATTTYVRQHGPPPRKLATPTSTPAPTTQHDHPPAGQQPTRSSTYSASTRPNDQSHEDAWDKSTETSSKWRPAEQAMDTPPEISPALDSPSSQSGAYVRAHGPPRRSGREAQVDEHSSTISSSFSRQDRDTSGEATSRFGGSWGASEQGRSAIDKESSGGVERTLSGRWREPADSLAPPPPPTNTRWKEPKEEPRTGGRRWKVREEGQMGSGRWGRSVEEDGDIDGGNAGAPSLAPSPPQSSSWKDSATDGWGLEVEKHARLDADISATPSTSENVDDGGVAIGPGGAAASEQPAEVSDAKEPTGTTAEGISPEDATSFRGSFTQQQQTQPVIPNASWEPQLPRGAAGGGDLWETRGHGRDNRPQQQRSGQGGSSTSGGASQPWGDPWGTSGFGLAASGDQSSGSMASFLENDEPRKERYLPPALRNRTPSQGNQEDSATVASVDEKADTNPPSLPDVASTDLSAQDLVIPGGGGMGAASPDGTGAAKPPLYEQQEQQQQAPLEDWQQGGAQAPHRSQQDQAGHPVEPQLHQQQPIHQCHQGQPAQPLHLHEHAHLDRGFQRNPVEGFSSFQPQDRQKHQVQEPALHQFQSEHFQAQAFHNQQQAARVPLPEQHLHRPPYQTDHVSVQRQQFNNQAQIPQQMHAPQQRAQHSLHQPHQQQPPQRQQQHSQQGQQGQQGHPSQQGYQQGHQQLDMSRQTSQAPQQMHLQQRHQSMQHPSSTFMVPSQGMGYADPRGGRGGLGGLPVQMGRSYRDVPSAQQQTGMPPSGVYGFQSPETQHKR